MLLRQVKVKTSEGEEAGLSGTMEAGSFAGGEVGRLPFRKKEGERSRPRGSPPCRKRARLPPRKGARFLLGGIGNGCFLERMRGSLAGQAPKTKLRLLAQICKKINLLWTKFPENKL